MVQELLAERRTVSQIASEYGVAPSVLTRWKAMVVEKMPTLFTEEGRAVEELKATHERETRELYAEIGKLNTQLGWLKKKSGISNLPE